MMQLFRSLESQPLRTSVAVSFGTILMYAAVATIDAPHWLVGTQIGFVALLFPIGLSVLVALWAIGATVRNALRQKASWCLIVTALLFFLITLGFALIVFVWLSFIHYLDGGSFV